MADERAFVGRTLPGERVLWSGKPATGILFSPLDIFLVPFSLLWCGFVVFWIFTAASAGGSFWAFGLIFLCFGLFFSVGRFAFDAWLRGATSYALTDKRVLILRTGMASSFIAINLDRLPQAQISERAGGQGTVRFGLQQSLFNYGRGGFAVWIPSLDPTPQFLAIPDARKVFDLVQNTALRSS